MPLPLSSNADDFSLVLAAKCLHYFLRVKSGADDFGLE